MGHGMPEVRSNNDIGYVGTRQRIVSSIMYRRQQCKYPVCTTATAVCLSCQLAQIEQESQLYICRKLTGLGLSENNNTRTCIAKFPRAGVTAVYLIQQCKGYYVQLLR